jgi:general secretion pathway protein C
MLRRYFWILNLALIGIAIFIGMDIGFTILSSKAGLTSPISLEAMARESPMPEVKPYDYYSIIVERNLFAPPGRVAVEAMGSLIEVLPQTPLKLALKGTVVGNGLASFCIIQDLPTRTEEIYRIGDTIGHTHPDEAGAKIVDIQRGKVILTRYGVKETLITYEGETSSTRPRVLPPVKISSNRWKVLKGDLASVLSDPGRILTQVRVNPYFEGDRRVGFKLSQIEKGSLVDRLGIRDGDIIKQVDGQPIDSIEKAIQVYKRVKNKQVVSVDVQRDGQMSTLTYEIGK